MQQPFITGLKLKNSLTNQLVFPSTLRNSSNLDTAKVSNGTLAGQPFTPKVTWATLGMLPLTQKLYLQRHDQKSLERLFWLQYPGNLPLI